MRTVAFLPLKLHSRRVPGKNLRPILGKPMCRYMSDKMVELREAGFIDEVYLFGTGEDLLQYTPGLKFIQIDGHDNASACAKVMEFITKVEADIYIELFATAPLLSTSSICRCLGPVRNLEYRSATTVKLSRRYIWDKHGPAYDPTRVPASDVLPAIEEETTGCYVFQKNVAELGMRVDPKSCLRVPVGWPEWIDVDTWEDWEQAEAAIYWKSGQYEQQDMNRKKQGERADT